MADPRTFTVGNVIFTINQDVYFEPDPKYRRAQISDELIWPGSKTKVQALTVCCGQFAPCAKMTATLGPGGTSEELGRWIAGFSQTVVQYERIAHYVDERQNEVARISALLQHGVPIHDGEQARNSVDGTSFPVESPGPVLVGSTDSDDEPFFLVPTNLNTHPTHPINATLRSISATDSFVTWLFVYRKELKSFAMNHLGDACMVPLTKVEWKANYSTQSSAAAPLTFPVPNALEIGNPQPLPATARYKSLPIGDGRDFPDTRTTASANEMNYWKLTGPAGYEDSWMEDDQGIRVKFMAIAAPSDTNNLLRSSTLIPPLRLGTERLG